MTSHLAEEGSTLNTPVEDLADLEAALAAEERTGS